MSRNPGDRLIAALGWREQRPARVVVFVAHPDDETLALGGCLMDFVDPLIVHATDGAPRDLRDARAQGFASAQDYADARKRELRSALALAGLGAESHRSFEVADQQAARNLAPLTRAFADLLAERRPDFVFTHAYEGGHPDHDAVAFVARAAAKLAATPPRVVEVPLYHGERGVFVRQRFGPEPADPVVLTQLPPERRELKRRMLACFASQRETLAPFAVESESFRLSPRYDFARLPNGGEILYEAFDWGFKGADVLAFFRVALAKLGLGSCL